MTAAVILFSIGLLCLIKGGDWFVDGAVNTARRFAVPELLVGATVVSIGTTLPEVMVSATSALEGHGEIAYGNAVGSVICNAALIAAVTIAVRPGRVDPKTLKTPVIFFFSAAGVYAAVAYTTGNFSRRVGVLLLGVFAAYMLATVRQIRRAASAPAEGEAADGGSSLRRDLGLFYSGAAGAGPCPGGRQEGAAGPVRRRGLLGGGRSAHQGHRQAAGLRPCQPRPHA